MQMQIIAGLPGISPHRFFCMKAPLQSYGRTTGRMDHEGKTLSLEEFYTIMINLFSKFNSQSRIECFSKTEGRMRGIFPVMGTISIGDIDLEILEGLRGSHVGSDLPVF